MSKLFKQYELLKKEDSKKVYLFRVGIFYILINQDAKVVSERIGLKITDLGTNIVKCGFPVSQLKKYTNLLEDKNIKYKVIDNLPSVNINDYINNVEIKKMLMKIENLDMDNISPRESFEILSDIQKKLKNVQNQGV